jgi:hypothetical protein
MGYVPIVTGGGVRVAVIETASRLLLPEAKSYTKLSNFLRLILKTLMSSLQLTL